MSEMFRGFFGKKEAPKKELDPKEYPPGSLFAGMSKDEAIGFFQSEGEAALRAKEESGTIQMRSQESKVEKPEDLQKAA